MINKQKNNIFQLLFRKNFSFLTLQMNNSIAEEYITNIRENNY